MLRTIFIIAIILFGIVQSFRTPFYALLFYLWIAYFRPEQWLWYDFFSTLNLSLIVGVFVLLGTLMSGQGIRLGTGSVLMMLFLAQSFLSTMMSPTFDWAWHYWVEFAKSVIICLLIITHVRDEKRLRLIIQVITISLGFEAVKQGWAQLILNPGGTNNNEHAMLGDNNGVAVGMLMLVSVLLGLARTALGKREKLIERFAAVGVLYRAVSTYSRGGFLSLAALGLHFLLRSKRKFVAVAAMVIVGALIVPVLPDAFWNRMSTIGDASENVEEADASVRGRIHFWETALVMTADRPFTGVGHNAFLPNYDGYDDSHGEHGRGRAVHSSWFGVLAETGVIGFALFVAIVGRTLLVCRRTQKLAKQHPELGTLGIYANAFEGSLIVFCVGGSFVNFQYIEWLWHSLAIATAIGLLAEDQLAALEPVPAKTATPSPPVRTIPAAVARGQAARSA